MSAHAIVVLDFGGQYTHLIANRIRRLHVYCEIVAPDIEPDALGAVKGVVLSGGPHSVLDAHSPALDPRILDAGVPVLGLCYGHQLIAHARGGTVRPQKSREYGDARIALTKTACALWKGLDQYEHVWMSHGDSVEAMPPGFEMLATTDGTHVAAMGDTTRHIYGLQFHPEVTHTPHGMTILDNFLSICGCARDWHPKEYEREIIEALRQKCGTDKNAYLLVSGGVDSAVCFELLNRALGEDRVKGLHIDNGLMRAGESEDVRAYFAAKGYHNLEVVDASAQFLSRLEGIVDPEEKRRRIGRTFVEVKNEASRARGLQDAQWLLAQGTIYPDTIESAKTAHADTIKTHHNRVEEIQKLLDKGEIIEPIALLYKDEVRALGKRMGMPEQVLQRHPFPGPGLGVRILCSGDSTQPVDTRTSDEVARVTDQSGYDAQVLPVRSVGVQGDSRSYAHPVLLKGKKDWQCLSELSTRITNEVEGVNRVVFLVHGAQQETYSAIRADVNHERVARLQAFDDMVTKLLHSHGSYRAIWQMPVVLLPLVNSRRDECVVLRPIVSREAMTARFYPLEDALLDDICTAAHQSDGIGDVFFDVTHKPPGTIEWE
jgi:GMP synthase (glutamine-hydrolysing)